MPNIHSTIRKIEPVIKTDLQKKMVLLAGPRQCGKSTVARKILTVFKGSLYNWDIERDRKRIIKSDLNQQDSLWVLDELHKYRRWKNWLKGLYDEFGLERKILVTGSARLNVFKKGGDSMQGRYYFHRLHPFTVAELTHSSSIDKFTQLLERLKSPMDYPKAPSKLIEQILLLGGFPEPFLSGSEQEAGRWRISYGERLIEEDLRQLHQVRELDRIELLYDRLPEVVTSTITMKRLASDLEVAFESIKSWLIIFENLYTCFRISPYGLNRVQAVKKQQKMYLWDWSRLEDPGARLENLVALHLLRLIHWVQDVLGVKLELKYYRDMQGHEVDFLIMKNKEILAAIEVKSSEQELDSGLAYLCNKVRIPHIFQIHLKGKREYLASFPSSMKDYKPKVWFLSVERFLNMLV
jgi:predicted AAA+ superfamily ATPase